jgi:uncharacterized membrane protein YbhN (UPF0104 family)
MSPLFRRLLLALLIGVLVYGAFVLYAGYDTLRTSLNDFQWLAFAAALALASLNYFLRFLKWEYYLAQLGIKDVPKVESLLVFLSGFVLTITPGKVGEVFKSAVLFDTHKVPVMTTAPIIVAERLTDVISIVVLIVIGSAGFPDGLPWAAAGASVVFVFLVILLWQTPVLLALRWMHGRPGFFGRMAPKLEHAWHNLRIVARPSALLLPTALSVLAWGAEGIALYLLIAGFGVAISVPLCVFFYATATLAGALIPVPGGLGVTETMIQEQLVRMGHAPVGVATAAMLMVRLATLWWAVVVGFIALSLLKRRYPSLLGDSAAAKVV